MKALKIVLKTLPFALILLAIYTLEYFGRKRMGMMRYLVFIKREFENGTFQPMVTFGLMVAVAILMSYVFWRLVKAEKQQRNRLVYWLCSLVVLDLWLVLPQTRALKSFHFGLIGWLVLAVGTTLLNLWHIKKSTIS